MNEITFRVEPCRETGGFVARWDAPGGGGITTQGDSLTELHAMISDAVGGYFEASDRPPGEGGNVFTTDWSNIADSAFRLS
jgi:predicted RNase H-like HicB family nuclease